MGPGKPVPEAAAPLSAVDASYAQVAALSRIADAIFENARATELLARATAGDFDQQEGDEPPLRDLAGRPIT